MLRGECPVSGVKMIGPGVVMWCNPIRPCAACGCSVDECYCPAPKEVETDG